MRALILSVVIGVLSLFSLGLTPSQADAQIFRGRRPYLGGYYGAYTYPSYYYGYTYPYYSSYYTTPSYYYGSYPGSASYYYPGYTGYTYPGYTYYSYPRTYYSYPSYYYGYWPY